VKDRFRVAAIGAIATAALAAGVAGISRSGDGAAASPGAAREAGPVAAAPVQPSRPALDAAADAILAEEAVRNLDHRPGNAVQWIVAVDDDGSPRFGYAAYLCRLIAEAGALTPDTAVRIQNHALQARLGEEAREASLGAVRCRDEAKLDDAPGIGA
jgi:rhamnose utilization protein RhaD (predicted bifunctional aldolase and dehydrogenase)